MTLPLLSPVILLPPPHWLLSVCSLFQCLSLHFACLFCWSDSKKLLDPISEFGKAEGYKVNIQKSKAYLSTNNEILETEIRKKNPTCYSNKKNKVSRNKPNQGGKRPVLRNLNTYYQIVSLNGCELLAQCVCYTLWIANLYFLNGHELLNPTLSVRSKCSILNCACLWAIRREGRKKSIRLDNY